MTAPIDQDPAASQAPATPRATRLWARWLAAAGFGFFLVKGLVWLGVFAAGWWLAVR